MNEVLFSQRLPILALRGLNVFPGMTVHFDVGRKKSVLALDAAMKAADVALAEFFPPPSETNFAGGLLSGSQSACLAACEAFARAVEQVAAEPKTTGGNLWN